MALGLSGFGHGHGWPGHFGGLAADFADHAFCFAGQLFFCAFFAPAASLVVGQSPVWADASRLAGPWSGPAPGQGDGAVNDDGGSVGQHLFWQFILAPRGHAPVVGVDRGLGGYPLARNRKG